MAMHTKGPWTVFEHDAPTGYTGTQAEYLRAVPDGWASAGTAFGIMGPECHEVAQVHPLYRNGRVRLDEERANAALIASAPDLLALLKRVECFCPVTVQDEIREQVAKAEGRS